MFGYWEFIAVILFIAVFGLFVFSVYRTLCVREASDIYELMGTMIIAEMATFGIVEWVWMSYVFYLLGQTVWCPNVMVYYFGVFTIMLLIMGVTGISLVYLIYKGYRANNRNTNYFWKGFLTITSAMLLGWILEDRVAGALTTWTVPHSWYLYWSSWTWLWAPYLAFMVPYWVWTVWYVWLKDLVERK